MERKQETATHPIPYPFEERTSDDLLEGETKLSQAGQDGEKRLTFEVVYTDGKETDRKLIGEEVTLVPVSQIIIKGTRQEPAVRPSQETQSRARASCDPNYAGGCVPVASDVDCAGGSGNGPAYVNGPVTVVGTDIYDLDRDRDGIACE
ncbi:G5 domain-containing protein [Candidatus Berkelbacteria bacterium]|nr:G5 domain-containing protein [Candidatus Berkelbacteria bacterium]